MPHLPTTFVHHFKSPGLFGSAGQGYALAFAPNNGRLLALGGLSKTINLWDAYEATQVGALEGHQQSKLNGTVAALAFSPDGTMLASGGVDKTVRLWRAADGVCTNVLTGFTRAVKHIAFHPTRPVLAAADEDAAQLFDLTSGASTPVRLPERGINSLAFTADGSLLAVAVGGHEKKGTHPIALVNPLDGGVAQTIGEADFLARALAFSPDGRLLAVALREKGAIELRDTTTWQVARRIKVTALAVYALAFSSQGVLGAALGDRVGLWDVASGAEVVDVNVPFVKNIYVESLAFSPDGQVLATCRRGADVRIYR